MPVNFPLANRQDSSFFSIAQEDVTVTGSLEGGYETTRPRTTRAPRKSFTTGFTEILHADVQTLQAFYDTVGKHSTVNYTHPITSVVTVCRIKDWPAAEYTGAGNRNTFNFGPITLKEV